jgi:hypothetical protein
MAAVIVYAFSANVAVHVGLFCSPGSISTRFCLPVNGHGGLQVSVTGESEVDAEGDVERTGSVATAELSAPPG